MATVRDLKIKTSTCKRIVKELDSYEEEIEREAAKTADMKAKGADPYDLKQQDCVIMKQMLKQMTLKCKFYVLAESRMMIPDCSKRLEFALTNLKNTLVEMEESGHKEGSEITDARNIITEVEQLFQSSED